MQNDALLELQRQLGLHFHDQRLLLDAFTPWAPGKSTKPHEPFGLLKTQGDALHMLLVTDWVCQNRPGKPAEVTSVIVFLRRLQLRALAGERLGLAELQNLSESQRSNWQKHNANAHSNRAADLVTTLLGAVYCDQGLDVVESFFSRSIWPIMEEQLEGDVAFDPRGRLHELVWHLHGHDCRYQVVHQSYRLPVESRVELTVDDELWGTDSGEGSKGQIARRMAAKVLSERFGVTNDAEAKARIAEVKVEKKALASEGNVAHESE